MRRWCLIGVGITSLLSVIVVIPFLIWFGSICSYKFHGSGEIITLDVMLRALNAKVGGFIGLLATSILGFLAVAFLVIWGIDTIGKGMRKQ